MRTVREIEALLDELERCCANDLEGQDLDFKEWSEDGKRSFRTAVDWAVCMANGGGGAVVFGVADKVTGREQAIRGVPPEVEVNRLKQAVYDGTDPKLTPVFEELRVPEGTGRLIVMLVYDGIPPLHRHRRPRLRARREGLQAAHRNDAAESRGPLGGRRFHGRNRGRPRQEADFGGGDGDASPDRRRRKGSPGPAPAG